MTCQDVIQILEELAPSRYACDWDNIGLLAGRRKKEVACIGVALEVGDEVLEQCRAEKVDMLITYHPVLFRKVSRVNDDTYRGRWLLDIIEAGMACYAIHTNLDAAPGGMSEKMAEALGMVREKPLQESFREADQVFGRGGVGRLSKSKTIRELTNLVKDLVKDEKVELYTRAAEREAGRVAFCTGAGREFLTRAEEEECDVLICGDIGERTGNEAVKFGVSVIDVGTYGMEPFFVPQLSAYLRETVQENVRVVELATCNSRKS